MENYPSTTHAANPDIPEQQAVHHGGPPPPYTQNPDTNPPFYPDSVQKTNIQPVPAVVVTTQNQTVTTTTQHRDYFNMALTAMAFFFIPTGIAASIFAYKANKLYKEGDVIEAERLNKYARNLIIASVIIGIMCYVVIIIIRTAQKFSDHPEKRTPIAMEILSSEVEYNHLLQTIRNVALRSNRAIISNQNLQIIFSDIMAILQLSNPKAFTWI